MAADHHSACRHEKLDDLLADPIAILLMRSDGVEPAEIRELLESARNARGKRLDAEGDSRPN